MQIKLAGLIEESIVDGPGIRFVVFVQGCPHDCKGCHNKQSHDPAGGFEGNTDEIFAQISRNPLLSGVTFSGGEPLMQPAPLLELAKKIKAVGLHLMIYTGYQWEALPREQEEIRELLALCDVLVDGPFVEQLRNLQLRFRGSENQRLIDVQKSLQQNRVILEKN